MSGYSWLTPADIAARFVAVSAQRVGKVAVHLGLHESVHHYRWAGERTRCDRYSPDAAQLIERELRSRGERIRDAPPAPNPTKPRTRFDG